jgi:hypothetical protein
MAEPVRISQLIRRYAQACSQGDIRLSKPYQSYHYASSEFNRLTL